MNITSKKTEKISDALMHLAEPIINKNDIGLEIEKSKKTLESIKPEDIVNLFDKLSESGQSIETIKQIIGKLFNIFFKYVKKYRLIEGNDGFFLDLLLKGNRIIQKILKDLMEINRDLNRTVDEKSDIIPERYRDVLNSTLIKLEDLDKHYIVKENILFPWMEKKMGHFLCLNLLWSFHKNIVFLFKICYYFTMLITYYSFRHFAKVFKHDFHTFFTEFSTKNRRYYKLWVY